jgi:hypothetical protein
MQNQEQGSQTGTRNVTYDVIAVLYHALQGAENCQTYAQDAQDGEARQFFEQAMQMQRQLADQGKQVLQQCLQQDGGSGGGSAFGWGSSQEQGQSLGQSQGQGQSSFSGQGQQQQQPQFSPESGGSGGGSAF